MVLSAADVTSMQSTLTEHFIHSLVVSRATAGSVDDYNTPARTWAPLGAVAGLVQPKTAREIAQLNQAGPVVSTYTILLLPIDLEEADRITVASGPMAGTYEIDGIRNVGGFNLHLEADAHMVEAG